MKKELFVIGSLCLACVACDNADRSAADNTERNARDRDSSAVTAGSQSESAEDRATTQRIRQALVNDASLSTTAKNIKVITIKGKVTLKGPVKTANERALILNKARQAGGTSDIDDQIEIITRADDRSGEKMGE